MNSLRNLSEFIEESEWIYWGIQENSLRNPSEFIKESEWIHWGIWANSWRNPSEFMEESELIHGGILVNSLRNPSEFIEESEWIHWRILVIHWGIWVNGSSQLNLFNSNESVELKKILKWLKNSVLGRRPFTLVLVESEINVKL